MRPRISVRPLRSHQSRSSDDAAKSKRCFFRLLGIIAQALAVSWRRVQADLLNARVAQLVSECFAIGRCVRLVLLLFQLAGATCALTVAGRFDIFFVAVLERIGSLIVFGRHQAVLWSLGRTQLVVQVQILRCGAPRSGVRGKLSGVAGATGGAGASSGRVSASWGGKVGGRFAGGSNMGGGWNPEALGVGPWAAQSSRPASSFADLAVRWSLGPGSWLVEPHCAALNHVVQRWMWWPQRASRYDYCLRSSATDCLCCWRA